MPVPTVWPLSDQLVIAAWLQLVLLNLTFTFSIPSCVFDRPPVLVPPLDQPSPP